MDPSPDIAAFTNFYHDHKDKIFTYILYRVSFDRDIAEDLTSEIFLKAWKHFDSFDRTRSFKTWIFTIAHNHLINFYKSRRPTLPLDEAIKAGEEEHVSDSVEEKTQIEKLMRLVASLPHAPRDLIIMRYLQELSNQEIAEIMHKEEGAVRTAISRALNLLRSRFEATFSHKST